MSTGFSKNIQFYCSRCDLYLSPEYKSKRAFLCCKGCEKKILTAEANKRDEPTKVKQVAEHVKAHKLRMSNMLHNRELNAIHNDNWMEL